MNECLLAYLFASERALAHSLTHASPLLVFIDHLQLTDYPKSSSQCPQLRRHPFISSPSDRKQNFPKDVLDLLLSLQFVVGSINNNTHQGLASFPTKMCKPKTDSEACYPKHPTK
jgi:hypothetical protein